MDLRRHLKKLPVVGPILIENEALHSVVATLREDLLTAERSRQAHATTAGEAAGALQAANDEITRLCALAADRTVDLDHEKSAHRETQAKLSLALDRIGALVAERDGLIDAALAPTDAVEYRANAPVADPRTAVAAITAVAKAAKWKKA